MAQVLQCCRPYGPYTIICRRVGYGVWPKFYSAVVLAVHMPYLSKGRIWCMAQILQCCRPYGPYTIICRRVGYGVWPKFYSAVVLTVHMP